MSPIIDHTSKTAGHAHGNHGQCPCFNVFLRVLLCYLKKHGNKNSYENLKARAQECNEKRLRQEPGYECMAQVLLQEIPDIVNSSDLRNVQTFLRVRAMQKKQRRQQQQNRSSSNKNVVVRCDVFGILHQSSR